MNLQESIAQIKQNIHQLLKLSSEEKKQLLFYFAQSLLNQADRILQANSLDLQKAQNMTSSMLERLMLNDLKIQGMAEGIRQIALLNDPLGRVLDGFNAPSGIHIEKVSVPLGIIAMIYESRPNVTSDTIALCLKSGNGVVLKGGKESLHSNKEILRIAHESLEKFSIPQSIVFMPPKSSREEMDEILQMHDLIDLVIPRGGESLIQHVVAHSKIPVIKQDKGVCHVYVHTEADFAKAVDIIINAKTQRPSVCNAMETLLVDSKIHEEFLSFLKPSLEAKHTKIYGCPKTLAILHGEQATEKHYHTEYGENILNIKVVQNTQEAIKHINHFGSHHSDAIITDNYPIAEEFLNQIDSACVYVNASTRFSDGGEFGFGAEIGISTNKLHARGPMGLNELVSYKFKIRGQGQIRQ